jgi:hypothetical protein
MKNRIVITGLLCLSFIQATFSQNYYQPGTSYTYRSLKATGNNSTSVLTVVFDANGNATVTRNESTSTASDKQVFQVLAPLTEVSTRTNSSDGKGALDITGDLSKYWAISFDNPTAARTENGITIECNCKLGSDGAKCSVSYLQQGNNLNATCVQESGCQTCEMKTTVVKDKSGNMVGGVLLLKANSVAIQ